MNYPIATSCYSAYGIRRVNRRGMWSNGTNRMWANRRNYQLHRPRWTGVVTDSPILQSIGAVGPQSPCHVQLWNWPSWRRPPYPIPPPVLPCSTWSTETNLLEVWIWCQQDSAGIPTECTPNTQVIKKCFMSHLLWQCQHSSCCYADVSRPWDWAVKQRQDKKM